MNNSIPISKRTVFFKILITSLAFIAFQIQLHSATITATNSGNWNSPSTWGGNKSPNATDDVIINSGITVNIPNSTAVCNSLNLNNNTTGIAVLNLTNNSKLVVSGTITLSGNGPGKNGKIIMTSNSTLECDGFIAGNGESIIIPGTGTIQLNTSNTLPFTTFYNLIIANGITSLIGNATIAGNITGTNGSLNTNGNSITLNGTTNQIITGALTISNLIISNTSTTDAVTLNSPVTITNNLQCNDGIINATTQPLIFTSSASVTNISNTSHVRGIIKKETNNTSSFIYPIGDGTQYRPIGIINPTNDTWTVSYSNMPYGDNSRLTKTTDIPQIHHTSKLEYWNLAPNNNGSTTKVMLSWAVVSDVLNPQTTVIAHWNAINNYWESLGAVIIDETERTLTSVNTWNTFSPFTLGSTAADESLPIELLYIESKCGQEGLVNVTWATATEENNQYFSVLRSNDGITWKNIAKVPGSGTTKEVKQYNFVDEKPTEHDTYYKIAQTDYNGANEEFDIMSIYCLYNHKHITFNPIPAQNYINFDFYNEHHIVDVLTIKIYNQFGQLISTQYFESRSDDNSHKILLPDSMQNGTYFIQVKLGNSEFYSTSFVKKI